MNREKNLESCLVISMGLVLLWFIYQLKWLLAIALIIGIIGLFFNALATGITWFWYKLSDILGFVMSKLLLSIVFFVILFPIALLSRLFNKNTLQLKKKTDLESYWKLRNHEYTAKDMEHIW